MFLNRSQLAFPRKIVAYYLLFCLGAVCWLTVGVITTSHTVLKSRTINTCLSRLGKTAAAVEIEYLRNGTENLSELLNQAKSEARLHYASIINPGGTILSHTNPALIGSLSKEFTGSLLRWGNVTGVRYVDEKGLIIHQYRVPLEANKENVGSLRIAVVEPNLWTTAADTIQAAPLVILLPLALIAIGALVLSRLTNQISTVEEQLSTAARQPAGAKLDFKTLPARDAASLGWNRMVALIENLRRDSAGEDLDSRLANALASRKQNEMNEILQNLPDGVAVTDMEGRITFANRALTTLLNSELEADELTGKAMEERLLEELPSVIESPLLSPDHSHRPVVSELKQSEEESSRIIRVARQPLRSKQFEGQVWSLRDVTQQKLAEKMRDQFIDTATHELRTPLSNIKAYAETLATCDSIKIEEQKEFCNIINSETTRLARFVDDLLSISSMEAGSLSAERQKVETTRLFEEVQTKVLPSMQQKNISFETQLPAKMADLKLDKEKIVAVLVNLLGNAAKYTPEGGNVAMKVKMDESQLHVAIEDTGVGISEDELPKVFDKFFRSEDARVQAEVGTGLGLSLAREVIRMHGGDLTVESELNKGSTFLVTIPIA